MPRRIYTYTLPSGFATPNLVATIGAYIFGPAAAVAVLVLILSLRKPVLKDANPWEAQELEWTQNYHLTAAPNQSNVSTEGAIDPPNDNLTSHWYWCMTGSCERPKFRRLSEKLVAKRKQQSAESIRKNLTLNKEGRE